MPVQIMGAAGVGVMIPTFDDLEHTQAQILAGVKVNAPKPSPLPIFTVRSQAGVIPATGPLILSFGSCSAGRKWNALSWSVVGSDDHTAVAATLASLYVGDPFDAYGLAPQLSQLVQPAQAVPSFTNFQPGTVWAASNEAVFVAIYGTAAQAISVTARFAEYPESAVTAQNI